MSLGGEHGLRDLRTYHIKDLGCFWLGRHNKGVCD